MFSLPFLLISLLLFFLGAVIGSFLNVVIYRTFASGESWVWGRSHCDNCGKQINWYDNIPLFSYFVLGGKCRYCKTPISLSNPVIEFLTGTLLVWWYWGGTIFFRLTEQPFHYVQPLFWLLVGLLLVIIFFADALYSIIPDEAVALLAGLTFLYRTSLTFLHIMQPLDFGRAIVAAVLCSFFFWLLWFVTKGRGMGLGDVKFAIPFALLLGWPDVLIGLMLSFLIGAIISIILMLLKKKKLKQTIPFGTFMVVALVITLLFGNVILKWYMGML